MPSFRSPVNRRKYNWVIPLFPPPGARVMRPKPHARPSIGRLQTLAGTMSFIASIQPMWRRKRWRDGGSRGHTAARNRWPSGSAVNSAFARCRRDAAGQLECLFGNMGQPKDRAHQPHRLQLDSGDFMAMVLRLDFSDELCAFRTRCAGR